MVAPPSLGIAEILVGLPGAVACGLALALALEGTELANAVTAVTVAVTAIPLVRPLTAHEVAGALTVQVAPPGLNVTV